MTVEEFLKIYQFPQKEGSTALDLVSPNKEGYKPLDFASELKKWDIVLALSQLMQGKENLNDEMHAGSALCDAARENQPLLVIQSLLQIKNISFNWFSIDKATQGYTALHFFIQEGNLAAAEACLKAGMPINFQAKQQGRKCLSPMQVAMEALNWEAIKLLAKYKAHLDIRDENGFTPIVLAAYYQQWDLVLYLAEVLQKAENLKDGAHSGQVLWPLILYKQFELIEDLLKVPNLAKYYYKNLTNWQPFLPLHYAVKNGKFKLAEQFIKAGFGVNAEIWINGKFYPAIFKCALEDKNWEAIEFLLDYQPCLALEDKNHDTVLQLALQNGKWDLTLRLAKLIQKTENLNDRAKVGYAIFSAITSKKTELLKALLESKNIDLRPQIKSGQFQGYYALHYAIALDCLEEAKQLIKYGWNVNKKDINCHSSPLEIAIQLKNKKAFQLLVQSKANSEDLLNNDTSFTVLVEEVVKCALQLCLKGLGKKNSSLEEGIQEELKEVIKKSLSSNLEFLKFYLFIEDKEEDKYKKLMLINGLIYYAVNNLLKINKQTKGFFSQTYKVNLIDKPFVPQHLIDEILILNDVAAQNTKNNLSVLTELTQIASNDDFRAQERQDKNEEAQPLLLK